MITLFSEFLNEARTINFTKKYGNFIVMLGTPGAGKGFVVNNLINLHFKVFNVDNEREMLAKKLGLDLTNPNDNKIIRDITGGTTDPKNRVIRNLKLMLATSKDKVHLPNIVLDSGGGEPNFISDVIDVCDKVGFDTHLVFVKTKLETALYRNSLRARRLSDEMVKSYHNNVITSFEKTRNLYNHVWIVENDEVYDFSTRPSDKIIKLK